MAALIALWMWTACVCATPRTAPTPTVRQASVRVALDDHAVRLQTPVHTLHDEGGRTLSVVGAVHVADGSYYRDVHQRLQQAGVVLHEGLSAEGPAPETPDEELTAYLSALADHGLAAQGASLPRDPRWTGADMTVPELERALRGAGATEAFIHDLIHERDRGTLTDLFADTDGDPRRIAIARLALLQSISTPFPTHGEEADWFWEVVIGQRNAVAVNGVDQASDDDLAVIYGADHTADLAARLTRIGFTESADPDWIDAIVVPFAEVQLGRVQVEQLLR